MDEPARIDTIEAWRDRMTAKLDFDKPAAEVAVREVYEASGLDPAIPIIWAAGPRQALAALAFVRASPVRLRRFAIGLMLFGWVVWLGVTLMVAFRAGLPKPADAASFAATLSAFAIVLGSMRPIPLPPGMARPPRQELALAWLAAAAVFGLKIAYSWALLHSPLTTSVPALIGALVYAAALGALPGLLLIVRLERAHRDLPAQLRGIGTYQPVGWQMQRARGTAWTPLRRRLGPVGWTDPLPARSREVAHSVAFRDGFAAGGLAGPNGHAGFTPVVERVARLFEPDAVSGQSPFHLDGIEDAPRACSLACGGATGEAMSFASLAFHLDRLYPFRDVAVAVRPATDIALDVEDRIHSDHGPAVVWADGSSAYAWHGQPVDPVLIEDAVPLTRGRIATEIDPSRRSVLIDRYGLGRYLLESGATPYQRDRCGTVYRLEQRFDEPVVAVRVTNHTQEADGSFHEYWLRVPPSTNSAREAVAWTFGLSPEEYDPQVQS